MATGDNLISRALAACGRVASVRLIKRIPSGGGLGGGSADAAAVLRWAGGADPEVAARLGADVPFCVVGGRARVEGVGERVTPLPFEPRDYLLVLPPFGVDTARVYRAWDEGHRERRRGGERLTAAALAVEPRLARGATPWGTWRAASPRWPAAARPGSSRAGPPGPGRRAVRELRVGSETARLVRARTVPAGWEGD